jgi:hypothetical protein
MPNMLEYESPPPTMVAPWRGPAVALWVTLLAANCALWVWVAHAGKVGPAGLACFAVLAVFPLSRLLMEFGVYRPRLIPDPRRIGHALERQVRLRLETVPQLEAADLDVLTAGQRSLMKELGREFDGNGFHELGEYVDRSWMRLAPGTQHLVTVFATEDPRWAAIVTVRGDNRQATFEIDFQTEFDDGTFLTTTDCKVKATAARPPQDEVIIVPSEWGVQQMAQRHITHLDAAVASGRTSREVRSLQDIWAQSERERLRILAWSHANGFITPEHVRSVMAAAGWIPELQDVAVNSLTQSLRQNPTLP